jgi:hypothetical protein
MNWVAVQLSPAFGFTIVGLVIVIGPMVERLRLPGRLDRRGRVRPTRVTAFLRSDHPGGRRAWVDFAGGQEIDAAVGALSADEEPTDAFAAVNGAPFFDWMAQHPERWSTFDRAMSAGGRMHALTLAAALDWSGDRRVCDVGGGTGELLSTLLDLACPSRPPRTCWVKPRFVDSAGLPACATSGRCGSHRTTSLTCSIAPGGNGDSPGVCATRRPTPTSVSTVPTPSSSVLLLGSGHGDSACGPQAAPALGCEDPPVTIGRRASRLWGAGPRRRRRNQRVRAPRRQTPRPATLGDPPRCPTGSRRRQRD